MRYSLYSGFIISFNLLFSLRFVLEQSIIASKIPPVFHGGPDFPFCRNPSFIHYKSVPLSEEHLSSFSAEVVSANLLIHSYAVCQPLGIHGPFSAYFCLARQEVYLLLLIVLSLSERGEVLGGPNRFYRSKKKHCKFHDAFVSPDPDICKRDWEKKAAFIYCFIISDCESVLMG